SRQLKSSAHWIVSHVEVGEGIKRLRSAGFSAMGLKEAVSNADAVILAVPDRVIGSVATDAAQFLRPGTLGITLGPAAAYAGKLPNRSDLSYFVTHPCHPSLFNEESDPIARKDRTGGVAAQHVVGCLVQGTDTDYNRGETLARQIWAPVLKVHRV